MYYASFGMLAVVMHLIINFEVMRKEHAGDKSGFMKHYRLFLLGILLYYIADILWGFLYDLRIVPLVYADTVLYFLTMGLSLFLWMRFTAAILNRKGHFCGALTMAGWSIFVLDVGTIIINFFVPVMFSFESNGDYVPGFARYFVLVIQFLLFSIMAVYTIIISVRSRARERLHYGAVGFSGLVMAVFIVLQTLYPLLPFYAIGCLIANALIHTFVELDEKEAHDRELGTVKLMAYKDPLTNVRNANAYLEAKLVYEKKIRDGSLKELGVVVFDLNNLKSVNDNLGHEAGDRYLKDSCKLICSIFKHSPVFRIGGDEFVTLLEGEDYQNRESLFDYFDKLVEYNIRKGGSVVAGGMDTYEPGRDSSYDDVFERADAKMYRRKAQLKGD